MGVDRRASHHAFFQFNLETMQHCRLVQHLRAFPHHLGSDSVAR
jgi:hypothetical protein